MNDAPVRYRPPTTADIPALAALGRDTFVETFGPLYRADDLNAFLQTVYSHAGVAGDMAEPGQYYLIAEADGQMVGYCKVNERACLDDLPPGWEDAAELKQLYVRASYHGRGVAAPLMQWALQTLADKGARRIALSVYSDNHRAQRFYERYGFRHIADTVFMVGDQADREYLYGMDVTAAQV